MSHRFTMFGQTSEEDGASRSVHLELRLRFYVESTSEEVPEATYLWEETSSFSVNLRSLEAVEETSRQILQHLSAVAFVPLHLVIDDIRLTVSEMVHQVARQVDLRADESLVIASTIHVTYHIDDAEGDDASIDMEELDLDDSQLVYEPASHPASRASVDALERRRALEHEESAENLCVVCQDEVGTGDRIAKMPCSHEFHEVCILAWLERAPSCPTCRFELPTD
ncbi:uncharacterized protein LOC116257174 [Nymphaea colorata]|uniref:uncharacterized protein LOC116257174 n=1 Tax=Nymphaea colorata TaxID=210225 RepID=UPI00129E2994|nr:uncharacterized protein LOC116257174 [Nymphaea colorata]